MNAPGNPKSTLRREARIQRDVLDPAWRREASARIASHALSLPEFAASRIVSAYLSVGSEVETRELIAGIVGTKGGVALPRLVLRSGRLEHRWVRSGDLSRVLLGPFGIPEPDPAVCTDIVPPARIDLSFVPGLAFDERGYRLGMGGGHYDRLFEIAPDCRKFGLGYSSQQIEHVPNLPHDVPVDGLVMETGVVRF